MLEAHRAGHEREEREAKRRGQNHPLLGLMPEHLDMNTVYRAAQRGELIAEKIGGRWFATLANAESWLMRTGRFKTEAAEERWRAAMGRRFS
jgi:hypothetical protein